MHDSFPWGLRPQLVMNREHSFILCYTARINFSLRSAIRLLALGISEIRQRCPLDVASTLWAIQAHQIGRTSLHMLLKTPIPMEHSKKSPPVLFRFYLLYIQHKIVSRHIHNDWPHKMEKHFDFHPFFDTEKTFFEPISDFQISVLYSPWTGVRSCHRLTMAKA